MTWEQARGCEQMGMTFGPHTVTHPILSRTTDAQANDEITESWKRVREELNSPVSVFVIQMEAGKILALEKQIF